MKKLDIIYEDKLLLVVNKPPKVLTISDGNSNNTLYSMARSYVKKQHKSNKIFIVHRLDKDTSGVIIFAKNERTKKELQNVWNKITKREYIALVEGKLKNKTGVIEAYLKENREHLVYETSQKDGAYSKTIYEVINYIDGISSVKLEIKTGRKHQIRVGFLNLGNPIVNDKIYGTKSTKLKGMGLHASKLTLDFNSKKYIFEAKLPKEFYKYIGDGKL